ncbi:hypothetical protein [Brevibacterium limosum]|nr:hypothetical protein [Brevibacterium limosum]
MSELTALPTQTEHSNDSEEAFSTRPGVGALDWPARARLSSSKPG